MSTPRGTRRPSPARAARWMIVALAATQALSACSSASDGGPSKGSPTATTASAAAKAEPGPPPPKCASPTCVHVTVDGDVVSYFVATRPPKPGEELVVVDPGGPGFDPAVASSRFETDGLPKWLRERPVLVQRERWATNPTAVSSRCWDRLAEAADQRRTGKAGPAPSCATADDLFDAPDVTAGAIAALAERYQPSTITAVGFSFGALRVAAASAAPSWSSDWRVLIADPAPPADAGSGPEVLARRVAAGGATATGGAHCDAACGAALAKLADALPADVSDRSVPLTDVDVGLGLASVAAKDPSVQTEVGAQISQFAEGGGGADLGRVADEADFASGRYGDRTYARGALVSLLGTCLAYDGWSTPPADRGDGLQPFVDAVLDYYRPCQTLPGAGASWPAPSEIVNSCALLNPEDPLLDEAARRAWTERTQTSAAAGGPTHGSALFGTADPTGACWEGR